MHKNSLRAEIRARRSLYWDSRGRGEEQGERDALTAHFREALDIFGVTPSSSHPLAAFDPVLLPVLAREDGTLLREPRWALHSRGDELTRPNPRFPAQSRAPIREAQALEAASVVLIAGLSVDEAGTRLGQGGGWYDRALLYKGVSAPVIACIFDWEYRGKELLPREDHDIPVDGVITPSHFIKLGIK